MEYADRTSVVYRARLVNILLCKKISTADSFFILEIMFGYEIDYTEKRLRFHPLLRCLNNVFHKWKISESWFNLWHELDKIGPLLLTCALPLQCFFSRSIIVSNKYARQTCCLPVTRKNNICLINYYERNIIQMRIHKYNRRSLINHCGNCTYEVSFLSLDRLCVISKR